MQVIDHEVIVAVLLFLGTITLYTYRKVIYYWFLQTRTIRLLKPFLGTEQIVSALDQPYQLYTFDLGSQPSFIKAEIIPYLHSTVLNPAYQSSTYFLLFGPSGAGKTATLIQLFQSTLALEYPSFYQVYLFPVTHHNLFDLLSEIEQPEKSVVLLDGLDEDPSAIINFRHKMDQIIAWTHRFAKVLISCKTGFFPTYMEGDPKESFFQFTGEEQFQTFHKITLLPLSINGRQKELQTPLYAKLIDSIKSSNGQFEKSHLYRFDIWEIVCQDWILANTGESISVKVREGEAWREFLIELAEKMYLHLKDGQLPQATQAEFQNLVWKHEISPREITGELLWITSEMKISFTHHLLLAYLLAKGIFEKQLPIAYVMEDWISEMASFYAEMCFARLFDSLHSSEGSLGYARFAPNYDKIALEEVPIDKYFTINRLYLKLYEHLDFRFLYSMHHLKAIYIIDGNIRDIKEYILPQLPNRPFTIYLIPAFGSRHIFCAHRGKLEERFFRSSLNPYEAFPSRAAKDAKGWLLSEFETDLRTLPNDDCKLDKVSVQDSNHLLRIYAYTPPTPEWSIFDQISLYVFTDGTMNIRMSNSYTSSDFTSHLARFINRIVSFYSEDDEGKGEFTEDDAAQIEDGIWEGRVWAWKKTDSYAHPVHIYMETPEQVEFVLWGVRNEP